MLKAVIFDMDGVIIDSEPLHLLSTQRTLSAYNVDLPMDYLYQFVGSTTANMFETIRSDYQLSVDLNELIELDSKNCKAIYEEKGMIPVDGIQELIKSLYNHGIKLAVASSSPLKRIEAVTKKFGIQKYFTKLISGTTVANPKPAPDIFLETLKQLGVNKKEAVIIEDSKNGTLAAKAADIACIGFINPSSGNQDLYAATAATDSLRALNYKYISDILNRANKIPLTIKETKRLIIRELSVDDVPKLYQIYQNKEVQQYIEKLDEYLEIEIEKQKAYIKNVYSFYGYGLWGVFEKGTNTLIGRCGIQNQTIDKRPEIELSYLLDREHWGCGYAIECCKAVLDYATNELNMNRIVAAIAKENVRSINVAKKLGMKMEKEIFYHGFPCYLYVFSLDDTQKNISIAEKVKKTIKPDTSVYGKRYHKKEEEK